MRLIDADKLVKGLELMAKYQPEHKQSTILGVCATINATPTIDAEPVRHGRWSLVDFAGTVRCSVCGQLSGEYAYCPNCGAKMDLEG